MVYSNCGLGSTEGKLDCNENLRIGWAFYVWTVHCIGSRIYGQSE